MLGLHPVDLGLGGSLARQRFLGQILLALGQRRLRLILKVVDRVLELLFLQLDLLAGGCDIHECPTDLGDLVQHLLIGEVEHLVGLFSRVERFVGLGLHDVMGPLEQ